MNKKIARGETFSFELETRKNLGQNFLTDRSILAQIVARADQHAEPGNKHCIEIGPGSGALTRQLLQSGWNVTAIEKDARAVEGLKASLGQEFTAQFKVIEADVLQTDPQKLIPEGQSQPLCIGNIPYYITSDILLWFLKQNKLFSAGLFMVQKEVAERLVSAPGHKDYGRLTVRTQLSCTTDYVLTAPARAFVPPPKVDSAVVELVPQPAPLLPEADLEKFERFTAMLFSARRKMLRKTVIQAAHEIFAKTPNDEMAERISQRAAEELSVAFTQRPEELSPKQILGLFGILKEAR